MPARSAIYLDANAGLPPLKEIQDRTPQVLQQLFNPSSTHQSGRRAGALLREARKRVAASLGRLVDGLEDRRWIWTSGGTEGLQTAIQATLLGTAAKAWFYSPVEHSGSLGWLRNAHRLPEKQTEGTVGARTLARPIAMPLDEHGRVTVAGFRQALSAAQAEGILTAEEPFLVSLLWVNNETGVIQHDLSELLAAIRKSGGYSLVDAAQAWGKVHGEKLSLEQADWLAVSGHKLGAFSGTGALMFSARARALMEACPTFPGTQQFGLRAGTENLLGAWSLGEAAAADVWAGAVRTYELRQELEVRILAGISDVVVQGRSVERVGNTLNVSFGGIPGSSLPLTDLLDLEGYCVSSGSACSSGIRKPSHVLKALGLTDELALATLRISLAPGLDEESVLEGFLPTLSRTVETLRKRR